MPAYTPKKAPAQKDSDWVVKGWINQTKNAGTYTVKDVENNLIGFVTKQSLEKLMGGAKGIPVSMHKDFKAD